MKKKFTKPRIERFSDVEELEKRIASETPSPGDYLYDHRIESIKLENPNLEEAALAKKLKITFRDLPISSETVTSLIKRKFYKLTEVQRCVIPHALAGRDILAASKTGSGKTLTYVIPIIENLYRNKWTVMDRTGALIVVPTRELAMQVFEVFRSLLEDHHELSYGLIIGGKSLEGERQRINSMNILICTPGRLLQHLQETELFDLDNLQMLVLDEADEILSLGFQGTLTEILNAVPRSTQTMLFSATLSKMILSLSKIALKDPENIFLHHKNAEAPAENRQQISNIYEAPLNLQQYAMTINHEEKIDVLFSFIRTHKQSKTIVFVSCCKQARFIYESFKRLRVGIPIYELQGRQKQPKRMAIFYAFSEKRRAVLITTNVASRGLDFPKVDWVVQLDIPENTETYVHRVGRTARFTSKGKSLAFVDPSESKFLSRLEQIGLRVAKIVPNPNKQLTIKASLQVLCSEEHELKYLAQKAFISFVKSVHLMTDKTVFDVTKIHTKELAESYGLIQTPVIEVGQPLDDSDREDIPEGHEIEGQKSKSSRNFAQEPVAVSATQKSANQKVKTSNDQSAQIDSHINQLIAESDGQKLSKSARKLLKFKEKLRLKREATLQPTENTNEADFDTAILLKNISSRLNQTRETQLVERTEKVVYKERDDGDDFLLIKRRNHEIDLEGIKEDPWKVSKRQLKKIKPEGMFGGKNIFEITEDNQVITQREREMRELRQNVATEDPEQSDLVPLYATKLAENADLDRDIALNKIKDKKERHKQMKKIYLDEKRKNF